MKNTTYKQHKEFWKKNEEEQLHLSKGCQMKSSNRWLVAAIKWNVEIDQ